MVITDASNREITNYLTYFLKVIITLPITLVIGTQVINY